MKLFSKLVAVVACLGLVTSQAFAYDFVVEDLQEILAPSDWAVEEIEAADDLGLLTENTSINFKEDITRFQFAELVVNYVELVLGAEIEADPADTFTDCSETAVLKASAAGIVTGVGEGLFEPDTTTDREQIATMLSRAIAYINANSDKALAPLTGDLSAFTDGGQVSDWAVSGVSILAANGIMNGTSATTLSPQESCTIEQSILLVYRLYIA